MKHSDKKQQQRRIDKSIKSAVAAIEAGEYESLHFGESSDGSKIDSEMARYCGTLYVTSRGVSFQCFIDCGDVDYFDSIEGPVFKYEYSGAKRFEGMADFDKWDYLLEAPLKEVACS